jgi:hypothetical protein
MMLFCWSGPGCILPHGVSQSLDGTTYQTHLSFSTRHRLVNGGFTRITPIRGERHSMSSVVTTVAFLKSSEYLILMISKPK